MPKNQRETDTDELDTLEKALKESWTLCNTMAGLSPFCRKIIFSCSGTSDAHEKAWEYCWKLCDNLYESRYGDIECCIKLTLDLRRFCQSLFDVLQIQEDAIHEALRASFEVNNQLCSADGGNISETSRESILDSYINFCNCLANVRNELAEETKALLCACWRLAKMLFNLRRNKGRRDGAEINALGSALEACCELCKLFQQGTQTRAKCRTSRPPQPTFTQTSDQIGRSSCVGEGNLANFGEYPQHTRAQDIPQTPMTEIEDTPISPDEPSPNPKLLCLGIEGN
jgi:hypothetical protein